MERTVLKLGSTCTKASLLWLTYVPMLLVAAGCAGNSVTSPASVGTGGVNAGSSGGTWGTGGSKMNGSGGKAMANTGGSGTAMGGAKASGGSSSSSGAGGATVQQGPIIEPGNPGTSDIQFVVRADREVRAISPLIYGVNGGGAACGNAQIRPGICRLGGNRWTAYNWETNASNAGVDYCSENDAYLGSGAPAKPVLDAIAAASGIGAATLVTVPILDYVAADTNGGSAPPGCSGDVRNSSNYLTTRFFANHPTKGSALSASPDTNDKNVYQDEFVSFIKSKLGNARVLFSLDNEPDLWSDTHPAIHPNALTYAELVERNIASAKAVRSVWPEAEITGLVSYGFNGYVNLQNAPDSAGKPEFIDYYLAKMKEASDAAGGRLVDYLDLHWYTEAKGGGEAVVGAGTSNAVVAERVQAPRSLWDTTYKETSWIADYVGGPIGLLPWLNAKISNNYPGTKLAITEWNYGGGQHISGGIATADALGIFGREGVQLATQWHMQADEPFSDGAFRIFRNYDGNGSAFGDTSISATTSDVAKASVYASLDAEDPGRVVVVAINRTSSSLNAGLTVASSATYTQAQVFTLTSAGPAPAAAAPLTPVSTNAFLYPMPPYSVSVIVPKP